jgi:RNA polymerase sigma-70 factor (ECF subfamily)
MMATTGGPGAAEAATKADVDFAAGPPLAGGVAPGAQALESARPEAFESVYLQYAALVRRVAWNLGGDEDLDDIVQEAFVKLWRGWDGFREQSQRQTWVYRVTVNAAREHWRRKGRFKAALQRFKLAWPRSEGASGGQEAWALQGRVGAALEKLNLDQREAVTLVYLEGLSLAEAAAVCGAPEGTLKSRLFHARARLQGLLKEERHG